MNVTDNFTSTLSDVGFMNHTGFANNLTFKT